MSCSKELVRFCLLCVQYTKYWCTGILLLQRAQQVLALGAVVVKALERDSVAPILCSPSFLLVGLLWHLLFAIAHLFPL